MTDSRATLSSVYQAPDLYDLVLEGYDEDLEFWLDEARRGRGPVLDVACGTGRVLLSLLERGIDADGLDREAPMLERLRVKARDRGLKVEVTEADMRDFTMPRRYARVFLPFNGFAHCDTTDDQLRCLKCCREHVEPGGSLVLAMSFPACAYWANPGTRVLELEVAHPETGFPVRMYDTRAMDHVAQRQHSLTEIEELDGTGQVLRVHRFEMTQRWVYRFELELLLRQAGFARCEILGGFDRRPLERDTDTLLAFAWRD